MVVETMMQEKLSCREAARQFEISDDKRVAAWERIYLGKSCGAFLNHNSMVVDVSHINTQLIWWKIPER